MSDIIVSAIRIEHTEEALGIGIPTPRLSWEVHTTQKNWIQTAYEVACFDANGRLHQTSQRVDSDQSLFVAWPFAPLQSRQRVGVRVRVWGSNKTESEWSELVPIEAGLLETAVWQAKFITPAQETNKDQPAPCPYLRHQFTIKQPIHTARLYISALGVYEAHINGQAISNHLFAPGWTAYDKRIRYQTVDVTHLLQTGQNAIGAVLGDGWYRGRLGFGGGRRNIYGDKLALIAQLEIEYVDGTTQQIVSNTQWKTSTGPILMSSIYDGETYDARLEQAGWSEAGFDDRGWTAVTELPHDLSILTAPIGPPVRQTEQLAPVSILQTPSGKTVVDFGQNLVGHVQITVQGKAGHTITLKHAELLENGELAIRPLRTAKATISYTLSGNGVEQYQPHFTFHGFRYVQVDNWPSELRPENLRANVIHSDMRRTGRFETDNPMLNQLHQNVVWGMRGNFLDIPTDCPQRDERLGWTGDIQVFTPTATFLYDVNSFLHSWLIDLAIEQKKQNGSVPHVVPDILNGGGAAAWGDAAVVVPWVLYERYGDKGVLADQFESMCAWVDHMAEKAGETHLWDSGFQFGDWLDPTAPPDKPFQARTDKVIVASAYFAYSARLVAQTASLLGNTAAHQRYAALAQQAKEAFAKEYITPNGRLMCDAETAYALAIAFDLLLTAEQRQRAGDRLAELVMNGGYHIRTGFVGTPLICDALCQTGHHQDAYRLLLQEENPSWLYPVTMGATTIWERWDSMMPDGSINPGEMTSFNHYALGAVADWMHRTIGGIMPLTPGYRHLLFAPRPGGGLSQCHTSLHTPYGPAICQWQLKDDHITLSVTVPPNCAATVHVPGTDLVPLGVGSGDWRWTAVYTDPDARGPYTVDDRIGDIVAEKNGRNTILQTLETLNAPDFLHAILFNEGQLSLREALHILPNHNKAVSMMNKALKELSI